MELPWFRFYKDAIDDAKLKLLAFEDRWHFVSLLCCKAQGLLDDQSPLGRRKLCIKLGLTGLELEGVARRLAEVELIEEKTMQPLAWDRRQFKSDSSTARTKKYRERHGDATDTDTDKETEKRNTYSAEFEHVWQVYPARPGRSKAAAYKAWSARLKAGDTVEAMTTGAAAYAEFCVANNRVGTSYVKQPETFFGPDKHFENDWTVVAPRGRVTQGLSGLLPGDIGRIPDAV